MVSVIVCTYNREEYLTKTLDHLKNQSSQSSTYEIVIINNNSTDSTHEICQDFIAENPALNIVYAIEYNQGHTYARNLGIKEAKGNLLAFIDDDAFVDDHYIENIDKYFHQNSDTIAIGGKIRPVYEGKPPKWMSKYLLPLVSALDMGDTARRFRGAKFPIGANMAYRKVVFDEYGLFDVTLGRRGSGLEGGDEKELISRLKDDHRVIDYVPEVIVDHIIPERRLEMLYIKGLATGVARSELKRLAGKSAKEKINKLISELIKIGGTAILSIYFIILLQWAKAAMLIKFRYWVTIAFLRNK